MDDEIKIQQNIDSNVKFEIGYIVPFWSSKPLHKYSLDVWREGVILDNIDITKKEYYLIGRNKSVCDIFMNNMTVSRTHCVIQHKDDGEVFLYDLDSVYGTFVNKRPISKKTYVKLFVGDTFRIGKSTKMFILNGPVELLPGEVELIKTNKKEIIEKRINQIKNQHNEMEIYKRKLLGLDKQDAEWGITNFDDEINRFQEDEEEKGFDNFEGFNLEEIINRRDLSDKQKSMIDKINEFSKKIEKLKEDIIKIKQKEDFFELSDNQNKKIIGLENKINDLNEKLGQQIDNLRLSLISKDDVIEKKFDRKYVKELNSDEDDFFDRTKVTNVNKKTTDNNLIVTENYETLKVKLENLIRNRQKMIDKLNKVDILDKNKDENVEEDTLIEFFQKTENQIISDDKSRLSKEIAEVSKEIIKTQKFISLVTPSHIKIKFKNDENKITYESQPKKEFLSRDQETIDKEKKKKKESIKETFNKISKISQKFENANKDDYEDEIIEDFENENITKDPDFIQKKEQFKKALMKTQDITNNQTGLITNSFHEIVDNISNKEFDLDNYNKINIVLNKRNDKKTTQPEIDYSTGGLQTFNMLNEKRERTTYGVTPKPLNRNQEEENIDEYDDFDPTIKFNKEHDISGNPLYK